VSIGREASRHYPLRVKPVEITPEPDEAEREAILAALAEEGADGPAVSPWAAALLPGHDDDEP
jgi:hypothetical protein